MNAHKIVGLNLGSRNRSIPGFLNIDIDQHEGVDIVGDVSNLAEFPDSSVGSIYAGHCLEHFPHPKTMDVLSEWFRVLEPGGILYVAVPDFRRTVELYLKDKKLTPWIVNYLFGDQGYPTAYHYAGFDFEYLRDMLRKVGFSEVSQVGNFPIGDEKDCSRNVSTLDNQPISLNVVAIKP